MAKKKQAANSIPKPRKGNVATEATPSVAIPAFVPKMDRPIPSGPIADIPSGPVASADVFDHVPQGRPGGPRQSTHMGAREGSSMYEKQAPLRRKIAEKNARMDQSCMSIQGIVRRPDLEEKYPRLRWLGNRYVFGHKSADGQYAAYLVDIGCDTLGRKIQEVK